MADCLKLDIVSAEATLFSGDTTQVFATSVEGEFEIRPGHTACIALLKPGELRAVLTQQEDELHYYISGGIIEVQPDSVTILADSAIRADDIDEATARKAQETARQQLHSKADRIDHSTALAELAAAAAQLRLLKKRHGK